MVIDLFCYQPSYISEFYTWKVEYINFDRHK